MNSNRLFVGGISQSTSEQSLRHYFNKYGEIQDLEIIQDRKTGLHRGFGFVTFCNNSSTSKALQDDDHVILGKKVEVKIAKPKETQNSREELDTTGPINEKKIFVGGLPPSLRREELKEYFDGFGTVIDAAIPNDPRYPERSRGFGFITFDSEESVENVLNCNNNTHTINNKLVEVKRAFYPQKPAEAQLTCTNSSLRPGSGGDEQVTSCSLPCFCFDNGYKWGYVNGMSTATSPHFYPYIDLSSMGSYMVSGYYYPYYYYDHYQMHQYYVANRSNISEGCKESSPMTVLNNNNNNEEVIGCGTGTSAGAGVSCSSRDLVLSNDNNKAPKLLNCSGDVTNAANANANANEKEVKENNISRNQEISTDLSLRFDELAVEEENEFTIRMVHLRKTYDKGSSSSQKLR